MFKLATFTTLTILAVATAAWDTTPIPASQCTTGPIECCQSLSEAGKDPAASILKSLGVVVQDANVLVGLTCSPITVVGVGSGSSCTANPVCCTDNSYGGVASIGCVPVTL
ncbi:hypothetical protein JAAARDRAFT_122077 [Jaapia argillacea MUCL 33604]|uniref:Hydrophobin n=1 Tax=Jaapia argillacea MUCL 33604 TaxID=933084 RepID=A0A067QJB4_9AGAM|nr:hypothetical protein JAAARDRAFT_122077 [Jaapia argillacea MUCL 33604]